MVVASSVGRGATVNWCNEATVRGCATQDAALPCAGRCSGGGGARHQVQHLDSTQLDSTQLEATQLESISSESAPMAATQLVVTQSEAALADPTELEAARSQPVASLSRACTHSRSAALRCSLAGSCDSSEGGSTPELPGPEYFEEYSMLCCAPAGRHSTSYAAAGLAGSVDDDATQTPPPTPPSPSPPASDRCSSATATSMADVEQPALPAKATEGVQVRRIGEFDAGEQLSADKQRSGTADAAAAKTADALIVHTSTAECEPTAAASVAVDPTVLSTALAMHQTADARDAPPGDARGRTRGKCLAS